MPHVGIMADMPGHAETHLYRDVEAEHDYLVVSEWTDEAAFNLFIESDRFNVAGQVSLGAAGRGRPRDHRVPGFSA